MKTLLNVLDSNKILKKPEMRYLVLSLFLCMSCALMGSADKFEPSYHNGNLESAKALAKSQNKFVFVKFYADWCVPCKWMDETTYSDPSVIAKINSNFVPLKVNIDDFDGFALKQQLAVSVLPTVVIYDPNGKMVKRIEETLPSSKMKASLDNVVSTNGGNIKRGINESPKNIATKKSTSNSSNDYSNKTYKLQLGVFEGFENTMNYLEKIKEKVDEQAMVLHDYKDGKTIYKVLIGRYETKDEATKAQQKMKTVHGLESVIY